MHVLSDFSLNGQARPRLLRLSGMWSRRPVRLAFLSGAALLLATSACWSAAQTRFPDAAVPGPAGRFAQSTEVVRHRIPGSDFPIAAAVEVPAGVTTVYLSGTVPPRVDNTRPANDREAYGGDTQSQTLGVLRSIASQLKNLGLGMGDIVKMQVFLVADDKKGNTMDFDGFMAGYTQFFGTAAQPRLPVRSAFQIAALANPAWLVEIEVTAVRPAGPAMDVPPPAHRQVAPALPNAPAGR